MYGLKRQNNFLMVTMGVYEELFNIYTLMERKTTVFYMNDSCRKKYQC